MILNYRDSIHNRVITCLPDEGVAVAAAHVADALVLAHKVGEEDEAGGHLVALRRPLPVRHLLPEEQLGRLEPHPDVLPGQVALVQHLADQGVHLTGNHRMLQLSAVIVTPSMNGKSDTITDTVLGYFQYKSIKDIVLGVTVTYWHSNVCHYNRRPLW